MLPDPPAAPTVWTIQALLAWTTDYLKSKGIAASRLEAQVLLAHVLGCARIELISRSADQPTEAERTSFRELIRKRIEGWPVAYLVGQKEFYLLKFDVSPAVLIPRPDTETLVLEALRILKPQLSPSVLDLGTGSGCIAVSIAHQHKSARVTAVDISPDAISMANRNATTHSCADRIAFLTGDLFAPLSEGVQFDLVVSNPPYITPSEMAELAPDIREHEPSVALDGGPDGLAFYRRIAAGVRAVLKPGGWLLMEIGSTQEASVRGIFERELGLEIVGVLKDAGGLPRVMQVLMK